jgi:hypothetical protein
MEQRILNILQRVQGEQDDTRRAELMADTNEELAQHFARYRLDLEELAFDLFNLAWSDVQRSDLANILLDVKTIGLADVDYIEEDLRGMRAYFQGKGGQIRGDIIRYERQLMPREELVTAIDMHVDEIATDFWGFLGKLQAQARQKLGSAPSQRVVELLRAGITGGATYLSIAQSALPDTGPASIDPILYTVAQASNGQATILGTNIAVRRFSDIGLDFGQNVQEDIFRNGIIARYKGFPVAQMENWEDFNGQYVLPDDELFIVGRTVGRVTWYGANAKVQTLARPSFFTRWETARDVGISVYGIGKRRAGRIVLT